MFKSVDLPLPDLPTILTKPLSGKSIDILSRITFDLLSFKLYFLESEDILNKDTKKLP